MAIFTHLMIDNDVMCRQVVIQRTFEFVIARIVTIRAVHTCIGMNVSSRCINRTTLHTHDIAVFKRKLSAACCCVQP